MNTNLPDDYQLALRYMHYLPVAEGTVEQLQVQYNEYLHYMSQSAPETAKLCANLFNTGSCATGLQIWTLQDAINHLFNAPLESVATESKSDTIKEGVYNKKLEGYAIRRQKTQELKDQIKEAKLKKKEAIAQVSKLWDDYIGSLKQDMEHISTRSPESFL